MAVGTYQAGLLHETLETYQIDATVVELNGTKGVIAAMEVGSLDAMVITNVTDYGYAPSLELGARDFFLAVNSNRPDLLEALNAAQEAILRFEPSYNTSTMEKYSFGTVLNYYLSAEEKAWREKKNNTIRIGYLLGNMPYSGKAADGSVTGILTTLMETLQDTFGIASEAVPYSDLDAMWEAMVAGEIDCYGPCIGDFYISEYFTMMQTDAIITTTPMVLYAGELKTDRIAVSEASIFCQHTVGVLRPDAVLVNCETMDGCIDAVLKGDADCLLISSGQLNAYKQYPGVENMSYTGML